MDQPPRGANLPGDQSPADEVDVSFDPPVEFLRLFVNYARLDEFDRPASDPLSERPEMDRWILSNLRP
ncbi:MAG: hypothetical protein Ct9H300mP1_30450 [Planctomycetaceae bacterium]|nr:MAG: hypothetical protein Ct9H300mP1_30450 [Planctomycetaceae bacterium]